MFAEEVRENGGAVKVRYIHNKVERLTHGSAGSVGDA